MQSEFMFTSESVTAGHPDKLCDQVSDAIVGHYLRQDPQARMVAECAISNGLVFISVKHRSHATVDVSAVARNAIRRVGYRDALFNAETATVMSTFHRLFGAFERRDENHLDDAELEREVAQDQATVFGFACRQSPALSPLPIWLAHKIARRIDQERAYGDLQSLAPDGKVQVGVEFRERAPYRIHSVNMVVAQRGREPSLARLRADVRERVLDAVFSDEPIRPDPATRIAINPEGAVVGGGPAHHAGLTGRKNHVDTYGGFARHGGAALSGKDPSRIDRVGAYAARWAAKNVVAAELATQCEVQLSYSIGCAEPVSVQIETYGTAMVSEDEIAKRLRRAFDFRVAAIVAALDLRALARRAEGELYERLAVYGHVGRLDLDLPWERTDRTDQLR